MTFAHLPDDELLELLSTEEDRLPRAAVDEFIQRGERMIEPLTRILLDEEGWYNDGDPTFWRPVHAAFILGAIGGEKTIPGLLAAIQFANEADVDWVSDAGPFMLAANGPAAIQPLMERCREGELDSFEFWDVLKTLVLIASKHPDCRTEVLDFIRAAADDADEPTEVRIFAGHELMKFARPEDRDVLIRLARLAEQSESRPLFDTDRVEEVYESGVPAAAIDRDWLTFYDPEEIEKRQQRWKEEEERAFETIAENAALPDGTPLEDWLKREDVTFPPAAAAAAPAGRNDPCPCGSGKKRKRCCG